MRAQILLIAIPLLAGCFLDHGLSERTDAGVVPTPPPPTPPPVPPPVPTPVPLDAGWVEVDAGGACTQFSAEEVRMPDVVVSGHPLEFTMIARSRGCGCELELTPGPNRLDASLCECCETCFCDPETLEIGGDVQLDPDERDGWVTLGGRELRMRQREWGECAPMASTDIQIVPPGEGTVVVGQGIWWARITGLSPDCCGAALPFVFEGEIEPSPPDGPVTMHLETHDCADIDILCDCVGPGQPYATWYPLGELRPGEYYVQTNDTSVRFVVPGDVDFGG